MSAASCWWNPDSDLPLRPWFRANGSRSLAGERTWLDAASPFSAVGAYQRHTLRLAAQTDQTDDILIGIRSHDQTKVVYERSTNSIVFVHPSGRIGTSFVVEPELGSEAYFRSQVK